MRSLFLALALLVAPTVVATAEAAPLSARLPAAVTAAPSIADAACSGCGCRGGAGYRLPSGKCAPRR